MQTSDHVHSKVTNEQRRRSLAKQAAEPADPREIKQIPLGLIDPYGDARPLDAKHVKELAESIHDHGLLQPVVVIRNGDRFKIPMGNHRKAACELLGLCHIEAEVWPEGTDPKSVRIKSLHENHVRQNERVADTLHRVGRVMQDQECELSEAIRICKIQGSTASKIKTVYECLSDDAKSLIQKEKVGVSIAYAVAKGTSDPETQVKWLTAHLAGVMPREAIADAANALKQTSSKRSSLKSQTKNVVVTVSYTSDATYDEITSAIGDTNRKVQVQSRRDTPVDLLPRFIS